MARAKLSVTPEKREKIKNICARRKGQFGDPVIKRDLLDFVKTDFKAIFLDPGLKNKIGEASFEARKQQYLLYLDFAETVSVTTITRTLNNEEGASRSAISLIELFDFYIEQYDPGYNVPPPGPVMLQVDSSDFSFHTIYTIKERAINRCSFLDCTAATAGPVIEDGTLSRNLGKAVCIYGLHPGQPRYDASKPQREDDINNAIWLCTYHADMVNQHGGKGYSAETLLKWKRVHELLMNAWVQGRKRPYFELNLTEAKPELAAEIISFFENQAALFETSGIDGKVSVALLANAAKSFFEEKSDDIRDNDQLLQQVYVIELGINIFIGEILDTQDNETFIAGFAALQKLIGKVLAEMAGFNKLQLPSNISKIALPS